MLIEISPENHIILCSVAFSYNIKPIILSTTSFWTSFLYNRDSMNSPSRGAGHSSGAFSHGAGLNCFPRMTLPKKCKLSSTYQETLKRQKEREEEKKKMNTR